MHIVSEEEDANPVINNYSDEANGAVDADGYTPYGINWMTVASSASTITQAAELGLFFTYNRWKWNVATRGTFTAYEWNVSTINMVCSAESTNGNSRTDP